MEKNDDLVKTEKSRYFSIFSERKVCIYNLKNVRQSIFDETN